MHKHASEVIDGLEVLLNLVAHIQAPIRDIWGRLLRPLVLGSCNGSASLWPECVLQVARERHQGEILLGPVEAGDGYYIPHMLPVHTRVGVRYEDDIREVPRLVTELWTARENVQIWQVPVELLVVQAFLFAQDVVEHGCLLRQFTRSLWSPLFSIFLWGWWIIRNGWDQCYMFGDIHRVVFGLCGEQDQLEVILQLIKHVLDEWAERDR